THLIGIRHKAVIWCSVLVYCRSFGQKAPRYAAVAWPIEYVFCNTPPDDVEVAYDLAGKFDLAFREYDSAERVGAQSFFHFELAYTAALLLVGLVVGRIRRVG